MPEPSDAHIERLRQAVRRRPSEVAQQIWLLAALAMKRGLATSVEEAFRQMYALKPEWTQLHFDVVVYWVDGGVNAGLLLRVFEETRPPLSRDHVKRYASGLVWQAAAQQERAIQAYQEAIQLKPDFAVAYHNLGLGLYALDRRRDGARACQKAAEIAPSLAEPHYLLGVYYNLFRKTEREAMFHFERFLELAYPYLNNYISNAELALAALKEARGERPYERYWNRMRHPRG